MTQGAATAADITSASWSLALDRTIGGGPGSGIGNIVQGLDDINQCIGIILTTVPGTDPLRPTFAIDVSKFIDAPLPIAQSKLVGGVINALQTWEPRIKVQSVSVRLPSIQQAGSLAVTVYWILNVAVVGQTTVLGANYNFGQTNQTTVILL